MAHKRILILSPHADDAELGCGGYMARMIDREGAKVLVALMTVGETASRHAGLISESERHREFCASMALLGAEHTVLSHGMNGQMHMVPMRDFVCQLDDLQEEFKPDTVLLPLPSSHQDHKYVWEVGLACTRPTAAKHRPDFIAAYEYPVSNWGDGAEFSVGRGGLYVNVDDHLQSKISALKEYVSQMRGPGHLISIEGAIALAKLRGLEAGCNYAELFHILRVRM
jgi:LmbE family N-acetylglucosaminyl deacetylase